jgi:Mrp family chromosome partitioning ATPase
MTALDQAFIKAFSQQGVSPVVLPPRPAGKGPDSLVKENAGNGPNSRVNEEGTVPLASVCRSPAIPLSVATKKEAATLPISNVFRDVLATLDKPSAPSGGPTKTEAAPAATPRRSEENVVAGAWAVGSWQTSFDMPGSLCMAEPLCIAESVGLPQPADSQPAAGLAPVGAAVELPHQQSVELPHQQSVGLPCQQGVKLSHQQGVDLSRQQGIDLSCQQSVESPRHRETVDSQPTAVASAPVAAAAVPLATSNETPTTPREFKPAWQVERFTWPRVCRRLMGKADNEFDRLSDALMAASSRGQRVLAMAGCHRGEGATTLLLCAARRLADRGVRLVLVDADLARPRLAKRLGVQPQVGWNEISEAEGAPLSDAVVEAASNGLALATVHDPASPAGHTTGDWSQLGPSLKTLKDHYEMVLVDLGPLESIESIGEALGRVVDEKIDAVLLVHNGRITSAERLGNVERELTAAGVTLAGMIENFVAA